MKSGLSFDWGTKTFVGLAALQGERNHEELLEWGRALARLGERQRSFQVLALAAQVADAAFERRLALRALGFELHQQGLEHDARWIAGIAAGRNGPALGTEACLQIVRRADELAFDSAAAELLPQLERAVEEFRVTGSEKFSGASHTLVMRLVEDEQFEKALEIAFAFLKEVEQTENPWAVALARICLADVSRARGRLPAALHDAERAIAALPALVDLDVESTGWIWLRHAQIASESGRLEEALASARKAAASANVRTEALVLLAELYADLEREDESTRVCDELRIDAPPELCAQISILRTTCAVRRGDFDLIQLMGLYSDLEQGLQGTDDAVPMFPASLLRDQGIQRAATSARIDLAEALPRAFGEFVDARRRRARHEIAGCALECARLLVVAKEWDDAEAMLDAASRYAKQSNAFDREMEVERLRARARSARGDRAAAGRILSEIQERIARRRDGVRYQFLQADIALDALENDYTGDEHRRLRRLFERRRLRVAQYELERRVARLLFDRGEVDTDAAQQAVDAGRSLVGKHTLRSVSLDFAEGLREDACLAFRAFLRADQPGAAANVFEQVRAAGLSSNGYGGRTTEDLVQAAARLAGDGALVSFYVIALGAPVYCLVYGVDRECRLLELELTTEGLVAALGTIYGVAAGSSEAILRTGAQEALRTLYSTIFRTRARAVRLDGSVVAEATTLEAELPTEGNLHLLTHGPLDRVPFAALMIDQHTYLVERFTLVYHPFLAAGDSPALASKGMLIVGNTNLARPLPGARRECERLAVAYEGARVVLDQAVDPAELLAWMVDREVVHLATHCEFDVMRPYASGLDLGSGRRLRVDEVLAGRIRCGTVVLTGCETSSADPTRLFSQVSLGSAFVAAGASRAIGSLWALDDAHAEGVSVRIHELVATGVGWASAVAGAQREATHRSDPRTTKSSRGPIAIGAPKIIRGDDPFYWGAFRCIQAP